jgi:hypothetical protein
MLKHASIFVLIAAVALSGCNKDENVPTLGFQLKFNATQERLDNFGNPSLVPDGNAAQTPQFNSMSVHFIELVQDKFTQLLDGEVVYHGKEVPASNDGFTSAVDFPKAIVSGEGKVFLNVPLSSVAPGTYRYIRVSVTYQNYDIKFNIKDVPLGGSTIDLDNQSGTVASFLGFNTKIGTHKVRTMSFTENTPQIQGYWAFESNLSAPYSSFNRMERGSSPAGATTVVNPLEAFGVIVPRGSCIVTGEFESPLVITGDETGSKKVTLSFSVNNSFEWEDTNGNGEFDLIYPDNIEKIADMGLRGLKAKAE